MATGPNPRLPLRMPMYLYIFENGAAYQSPFPPTEGDMEAVANGVLDIITYCPLTNQFYEVDEDSYTFPTPRTKIENDCHIPGPDNTPTASPPPGEDWDPEQDILPLHMKEEE